MVKIRSLSIGLILIAIGGCIHTDPWTKTDKAMEGVYMALHAMDWNQTRNADWDKFYEKNPILGSAPSKLKTDLYFLTTGLLHPLVTHILPQEWRVYWQSITIGMEVYTVGNNFRIGMGFGF